MKKLLFISMSFLFLFAVNVGHADAVPNITGEYSGSYTIVVSNCSDLSDNGTYYAILELSISNQTNSTFSGSATGTFDPDLVEYIQLSGTITESGQISGITSHTFLDSGGEGTFTGQLSGNTLSIENPGHDTYGDTCTYIRYMSAWRETHATTEAKLFASDGLPRDFFGYSVSISGDVALVGAYGDDDNGSLSGSAYVFRWNGSNWVEEQKLLAPDGAADDRFGYSVSTSADVALVGAWWDNNDNALNAGSAYVFRYNGSSWVEEQKLLASDGAAWDTFSSSVSISADVAIVGADRDDDNGDDSGSAYVFRWNGSNWVEEQKLLASDGAAGDRFGTSVSISGDVALVGGASVGSGSAYVFRWNGSSWVEEQKLLPSDGAAFFGWSVSISGDVALVGAYVSGSAYVFRWNGSSWVEEQKLLASDGAAWDLFGISVSISGNVAMVGAEDDDIKGSAYIFRYNGSSWVEEQKLLASDGAADDEFGKSVSISGDVALVGAFLDYNNRGGSGSAYVYAFNEKCSFVDVPPGNWAEEHICKIYEAGITSGCSQNPPMYCPEDPVTRAQMAVFLERGINGSDYDPPGATGIFDDCPVSHWAADWVEQFYNDGITSGCSTDPPLYCPDDLVTRAQMAVFLLRSMYGNGYTPPSAEGIFDDVPVTHWAAVWIEQLYDEGITGGCSTDPPLYCPDDVVNRAQMAVFIVRAFGL